MIRFDPNHERLALLPPTPPSPLPDRFKAGATALAAGDLWGCFSAWSRLAETNRRDAEALFLLGTLLATGGKGLAMDLPRALELLLRATRLGHGRAAFNAGLVMLRQRAAGEVVPAEVVALLRLAGELSDVALVRDRVHRLTGALLKEIGGDATAVRSTMAQIMRGDELKG